MTAGVSAAVPRIRPAVKVARPFSSVVAVPSTSLFLASSCSSTPAIGLADASERVKTFRPSVPA